MAIPESKLAFQRHVRKLRDLGAESLAPPETIVSAVLYVWRKKNFPLLPSRAPQGAASTIASKEVEAFVSWLSGRSFLDSAYWLATAYAILVSEEKRTKRALFFTPPILANRLIDQLIEGGANLRAGSWHDPACGGAAFLVPVALRMASSLEEGGMTVRQQLASISRRLSGNDLDPFLLKLSRALLEMALYVQISTCGVVPKFKLTCGDALSPAERRKKVDVLVVNPPYRKLDRQETRRYLSSFSDVIQGQPNIYNLFISQAINKVRRGGFVGLLTPTSFLSGASFSKLRQGILKECEVDTIDLLSERSMFMDVDQETAITTFRKRRRNDDEKGLVALSVLREQEFKRIGDLELPEGGIPWPVPRSEGQARALQVAQPSPFRLGDYGYACGIGNLVAYRDKRPRFEAYLETMAAERKVLPLIWATDITVDGELKVGRRTRFERHQQFVEVLATAKGVITRPAVVMQRLTSSDQKSRLVAAHLPAELLEKYGGVVCENHVIVLEATGEQSVSAEVLSRLLNSEFLNDVFRCISGPNNVSVFELKELMLPDPERLIAAVEREGCIERAVEKAFG